MDVRIHRLMLPLRFPEGLSAGEESMGNHAVLARDGRGHPVLRGSSLAGCLRHEWETRFAEDPTVWFGDSAERSETPSALRVPDCVLRGDDKNIDLVRTHNAINRHTGAVLDGGLYSMEALPPGTTAHVCLWLHDEKAEAAEAKLFLRQLVRLFEDGVTLGGSAARGIGRAVLDAEARYAVYELSQIDRHAAYLDEHRAWRNGVAPATGEPLRPAEEVDRDVLVVHIELGIPRGEDLLVADGQGCDYEMEPQRVVAADGKKYWRIPGSSLRGVFKGWFIRLAARAGASVADTCDRQLERQEQRKALKGDKLAWGFKTQDEISRIKQLLDNKESEALSVYDELIICPVMHLFGSCFGKGRLHIADALSIEPIDPKGERCLKEQKRAHVAVDRFTGGANEGFFFVNSVLTDTRFRTTITVRNPDENEVRWLIATLRALQVGVLRVGSSKAGGRLSLAVPPEAHGAWSELFEQTDWMEAVS